MTGLLRQFEVCERLGICDETWRRWRASGLTPKPADVPGVPRWKEADIDAFGKPEPSHARQFFRTHQRTLSVSSAHTVPNAAPVRTERTVTATGDQRSRAR